MGTVSIAQKKEHLLEAIKFAKSKGATAIKLELEAQMGRYSAYENPNCTCDLCSPYSDEDEFGDEECLIFMLNAMGVNIGIQHTTDGSHADYAYLASDTSYEIPESDRWLQYAEFYNDGSVDSELTITIRLDRPEWAEKALEAIEAFNHLAKCMGQDKVMSTSGAGLHTAFLFSKDASYPVRRNSRNLNYNLKKISNFRRAMLQMLPGLYFLAAPANGKNWTRGLGYRMPSISIDMSDNGRDNKYSAIHIYGGALEFRVFDTCYDKPDQIIDHIIVMSKSLVYLDSDYQGPDDVTRYRFGNNSGYKLDRLYATERLYDMMIRYVKILKPGYYTVSDLKEQRGFNVTKAKIRGYDEERREKAELGWQEYEERRAEIEGFERGRLRQLCLRDYLAEVQAGNIPAMDNDALAEYIESAVRIRLGRVGRGWLSKEDYCHEVLSNLQQETTPEFLVSVG